ncbi:pyridoxal phosphate-dependent transferase [Penicillium herquei]|nr:pyridoxal phosphate-dependent transferase [Penicillium herquei]
MLVDTLSTEMSKEKLSLASRTVHADDHISVHRAVAPAMHVSTTFRYNDDPEKLTPLVYVDHNAPLDSHVYSRITNPSTTRLEAVLTAILGGPAITYSSGLSAFHALLIHLNPRRIAITGGYHGCHSVISLLSRLSGLQQLPLDCDVSELQPGDVIHVETPINPTGEAVDLAFYAEKARRAGAFLTYFGGHSDMLCGVLAVNPGHSDRGSERMTALLNDRMAVGSVMGSLEGWLGIRSLRTLELRVKRQSATATALVAWLSAQLADPTGPVAAVLERVQHASLQPGATDETSWLRHQMPGGYGPVFALWMKDNECAKRLPSKLRLFDHATSLGGVESLIEWRAMMDPNVDQKLLRVSVGVEELEDLKQDLLQGLEALRMENSARTNYE